MSQALPSAGKFPSESAGQTPLCIGLAVALGLTGAVVMAGWATRNPVWHSVNSSGPAMVFNTALCLVLAGAGLLLGAWNSGSALRLRRLAGWGLGLLATLALMQNVLRVDLGLDWPSLHDWYGDGNPRPGRMAPNTALAFLLAGAVLAMPAGWVRVRPLKHTLAAAVVAIGALGLLDHLVPLGLVVGWYGSTRMALPTAIAVMLLGTAMLVERRHRVAGEATTREGETRSHVFLGAAVTVLLSIAMVSYGGIQALLERAQRVEHTYQVRTDFEQVMASYRRARIARRNFVVEGSPGSQEEFSAAAAALPLALHQVVIKTADNPRQQARLAQLRPLFEQDLALLGKSMQATQGNQSSGAAAAAVSATSLNGDQVDRLAKEFEDEEVRLLAQRQQASDASSRRVVLVIVVGNVLGFSLLLYTFWMLRQQIGSRARAELRLARSNTFLDSLVENIPNMIFVKDAARLRFVRFNKAGEDLLGLSRSEMLGKSDHDLFPAEQADFFTAKDRAVLESKEPLEIAEEPIQTAHKGVRTLRTMKMPILDEHGQALYLLGISDDVTERRLAEQAISDLSSELRQKAQELEITNKELESFSYSVSHDLRAPLRAIAGFASMLEEDYGERLDAEGARYLSVIRHNGARMGGLIDDLLAFSRLGRQAVSKAEVDMDGLVREVTEEALQQHRAATPPHIEFSPLPPAHADRALLRQVWANLMSNALKYSAKTPRPVIRVGGRVEGSENLYWIADNGAGFSMDYYDKLFRVFQRLHRAEEYEGTGVGLALVQRVITRHGGRVWAQGEIDNGAVFTFTLPRGGHDGRTDGG